jgi:hypothetical protein
VAFVDLFLHEAAVGSLDPLGSSMTFVQPPPHDALDQDTRPPSVRVFAVRGKATVDGLDLMRGGEAAEDFVDTEKLGKKTAASPLSRIRPEKSKKAEQKVVAARDRNKCKWIKVGHPGKRASKL